MSTIPEPPLPELVDLNLVESIREFGRWQRRSLVTEEDGVLMVAGTTDHPIGYSNCVARVDRRVAPRLVLERAVEFFGNEDRDFTVWVRGDWDEDLAAEAEAHQWGQVAESPWMVIRERLAPPTAFDLRWASSESDISDARLVNREAYEDAGMPAEEVDSLYGDLRCALGPHLLTVTAYCDGVASATAMALLSGRAAGIYWVGTRPSARGRGLAGACTRALTNACIDAGAALVALQATQMGEPVYRSLGYETISRHRWYLATSRR